MPDLQRRTHCLIIVILLGGIAGGTSNVDGAVGSAVVMPGPKLFSKLGNRVTVDTTWVENDGYRPVRVRFESLVPLAVDRAITFRISLYPGWFGNQDGRLQISEDFVLPAGATRVDTTVLVPCHELWDSVSWNVAVDGSVDAELGTDRNRNANIVWIPGSIHQSRQLRELPRVLVVGDAATEADILQGMLRPLTTVEAEFLGVTTMGANWKTNLASATRSHFVSIAELPDTWLGYSCLDIVCISEQQLLDLRQRRPDAVTALNRWIMAGGNLWVYGLGSDPLGLARINDTLGLSSLNESEQASLGTDDETSPGIDQGWDQPGWHQPDRYVSVVDLEKVTPEYYGLYDAGEEAQVETVKLYGKPNSLGSGSHQWAWRTAGNGWIAAFAASQPFQTSEDELGWVLGSMTTRRANWQDRYGATSSRDRAMLEFWEFVVPGIGIAPVGAFQILITLFVILIGPVNYVLLRRMKRLQLLIITVPLGSVAVACTLFLYALLGDGITTRVRARSFCELDQRTGEEVVAARLSYYAGIAPSGGLHFSRETAVYPIRTMSGAFDRNEVSRLDMNWSSGQHLQGGWLNSRTPTQYLTVTARASQRELKIRQQGNTFQAGNFLGRKIEQLVLADSQGKLYWADSIAVEELGRLEPIESQTAQARLVKLYNQGRPRLEENFQGYGSTNYDPYRFSPKQKDASAKLPAENSPKGLASSLFELRLQSAMLRLPPAKESPWQPRTYLAILQETDDDLLGVDGAQQEGGFHVIFGKW